MRIAALVIGLFVGIITLFQSCALGAVSSLGQELSGEEQAFEQMSTEAGSGILVAFSAVLGAAFAIGKPKASGVFFAIGAAIGIIVGLSAETFRDLSVWGFIMLLPSALAFFGQRELKPDGHNLIPNSDEVESGSRKIVEIKRGICWQCGKELLKPEIDAKDCIKCGAKQGS